ncbi:MAG: hypothetical protein PWR17_31 [Candidatus Methanomethylophilaceae archaeon]|nr:hypothetical protein [Candidatus Methanomethylophilaceae archaeon]
MKFTIARLCGGAALMAVPQEEIELDMAKAAEVINKEGHIIKQKDEMMIVFMLGDIEATLYVQGKVMFFPLENKSQCIEYATSVLENIM